MRCKCQCSNSRSNASCPSKPCRYLSCTQRRKLGSSTAARTPSSIVSGSSSAKQQLQAAAASRDKPERSSSNIPRGTPSQAVLARKLTPLQRGPATRHIKKKTDLQQHRYQPSCLHKHHFRACDICLHISHDHSKCLDLANFP